LRPLAHSQRVRGGDAARVIAASAIVFFATALAAADALFPQPLHLIRRIDDPVSHSATTIHEYCAGDQVVTLAGEKVTIADHGKQELTEIDRAAGTYSVTSFAHLDVAEAATRPSTKRSAALATTAAPRWTVSQSNDTFQIAFAAKTPMKIGVRLDRNTRLSKAAFEVLIGASFPHVRTDVHDALLNVGERREGGDRRIAANAAASNGTYSLPIEQTVTFHGEGEAITIRSTVLDVRSDLVPPGTLLIPPGSRLVESHTVRLARELRDADQLPSNPSH
jgi:hypothetical protein